MSVDLVSGIAIVRSKTFYSMMRSLLSTGHYHAYRVVGLVIENPKGQRHFIEDHCLTFSLLCKLTNTQRVFAFDSCGGIQYLLPRNKHFNRNR